MEIDAFQREKFRSFDGSLNSKKKIVGPLNYTDQLIFVDDTFLRLTLWHHSYMCQVSLR